MLLRFIIALQTIDTKQNNVDESGMLVGIGLH
jgi:hypothetical protein